MHKTLPYVFIQAFVKNPFYQFNFFANPGTIRYTSRYVTMENLMIPPGQSGAPPPIAPAEPARLKTPAGFQAPETKYIAPKVVDSIPAPKKPIDLRSGSTREGVSDLGDTNGTGDENGSINGVEEGSGTGGNGGEGNGVYSSVTEMPKFKDDDINKFREWDQKKTKYPEVATTNGIQGGVYVTFIVEKDGTVTNCKVIKGVDPLINDEALKAVMSSPKWSPGKLRGEAVRVTYIIMLNFKL